MRAATTTPTWRRTLPCSVRPDGEAGEWAIVASCSVVPVDVGGAVDAFLPGRRVAVRVPEQVIVGLRGREVRPVAAAAGAHAGRPLGHGAVEVQAVAPGGAVAVD